MGQKDLLYCLKIEKVSQGIFHLLIICNSIFITQKIMLLVINQLYLLRNILVYTQNKRKKTGFLSWFTRVHHTHKVAGSFPAGNRVIFCLSNVDPKF